MNSARKQPALADQRGISLVGLTIFLAIVFALFNVYAYFNPNFELSKYSPVYYFKKFRDEQRIKDLKKLQVALDNYYNKEGQYPGGDGWCGILHSILHGEVMDALSPYFPEREFPQDPSYRGSNTDYFYARLNRNTYVLMAALDIPPPDAKSYNFSGCYNWPGDGVYNYSVSNAEQN